MAENTFLDPTSIILGIVDDTGETVKVTVPLDFSDFGVDEMGRLGRILDTESWADQATVTCGFLFAAAGRQVDLDDASFPAFAEALRPMWDADPSVLKVG